MTSRPLGGSARDPGRRGTATAWLVWLAVLCGVGVYVWWQRAALEEVTVARPGAAVWLSVAVAVNLVASNELNLLMVTRVGAPLGRRESFWLTWIATFMNSLIPGRAGAAFRAWYLKRAYGLAYAAFASTVLGYYVAVAFVSGALAAIALSRLGDVEGRIALERASWILLALVVVAMALPRVRPGTGWIRNRLAVFTSAWRDLLQSRSDLVRVAALAAAQVASSVAALWSASALIGLDLGAAVAITVGSVGALSTLVAVTPGSLGVYEASVAFTGSLLGASAPLLVVAALVQRAALVAILGLGAPVGYRALRSGGG